MVNRKYLLMKSKRVNKLWPLQFFMIRGPQIPVACSSRRLFFSSVAPNICEPSVWNLIHVTVLARRTMGWLVNFWEIVGPWIMTCFLYCLWKFEIVKLIGENVPFFGPTSCVKNYTCVQFISSLNLAPLTK